MSIFKKKDVLDFAGIITSLNDYVKESNDIELKKKWNNFISLLANYQKILNKKEK